MRDGAIAEIGAGIEAEDATAIYTGGAVPIPGPRDSRVRVFSIPDESGTGLPLYLIKPA